MQLTSFTDYCLRVLMYVAVTPAGKRATVTDIAAAFGISRSHLTKVVHRLGKIGVLRNVQGRGGGLELSRPAEDINVGAVVRAVDTQTVLVECFDRKANQCVIAPICRLREVLANANEAFYAVLDDHTLADITRNRQSLAKILVFERQPRVR